MRNPLAHGKVMHMKTNTTPNENKNQTISARIAVKLSEGMTIEQAVDFVLGAGAFQKLTGEIYDTLRA